MTSKKHQQIDDNLRRVYNEMLDEDLPDRFRDLLDKLRDQEEGTGVGTDAPSSEDSR